MTCSLFFNILKNKYLVSRIFDYCKSDDDDTIVGYSYYDIPLEYLCRKNRFDLFDHRWDVAFNSYNGDIDHLLDIRVSDILQFCKYNNCLTRLGKVWNLFFEILKASSIGGNNEIDLVLGGLIRMGAEKEAIQFATHMIGDINVTNSQPITSIIEVVAATGSTLVYDVAYRVVQHICSEKDNVSKRFWYNCLVNAGRFDKSDLFYYIFNKHFVSSDSDNIKYFFISDFPTPFLKYILNNVPLANLKLNMFPCFEIKKEDMDILDKVKDLNLEFSVVCFEKAYHDGNIELLDFLYKNYKVSRMVLIHIPNLETLKYYLTHQYDHDKDQVNDYLEISVLHSLELVQYLHSTGFKFTAASLNSPYQVLQFLFDNNCLEGVQYHESKLINLFYYDLKVVKLLHEKFGAQFTISLSFLKSFIFNGPEKNYPLIEYIINSSLVPVDIWSIINFSQFTKVFRLVIQNQVSKSPLFLQKFITLYLTSPRVVALTYGIMECINQYDSTKCILLSIKKNRETAISFWLNYSFRPSPDMKKSKVFKLLLNGFTQQEFIQDMKNRYHITDVLLYAINTVNYKLIRYTIKLLNEIKDYGPINFDTLNTTHYNAKSEALVETHLANWERLGNIKINKSIN
ncbi:hypothetical protein CYY_000074 [Polysphondylium violaceum]|uniref:Uncharacterized protein n=1 Tax=Polysphondylium violaceum TaxID=133409 RepID=A0A8J4Q4B0_9MYCE|nr:hypothetical protein CYY_000074 [Polysphondylium violaceum]